MNKNYKGIRITEVVSLALGALKSNRLRSILTMLGIAIGVFSVVGVMTTLSAIRQSIDSSLSFLGANVFEISRRPAIQIGDGVEWWKRPPVSPRQAYDLKEMLGDMGVPVTVASSDGGERATYGDRSTGRIIRIIGTNENYLITNKYDIAFGRNISPADNEFNRPVTVIGNRILEELFPNEDPIGKEVVMDGSRYTVVGVLEERGEIFGQSMDNIALVPITRFVANNWHWHRSMDIAVQAPNQQLMGVTQDQAIGAMRLIRGLEPEDENDFEVSSNDALQEAFARIAVLVGSVGLAVSVIALACAGIGIMNIMLVSVTERTREIGILKSIGARKADILTQFLLEAVFLSELGALVGIILGFALGNIVASNIGVSMIIPWFWIFVAVAVCSVIGIVFGMLPAYRAAALDPIEALRYE